MKKYREYVSRNLLKRKACNALIDFYEDSQSIEYEVHGANDLGVRQQYIDLDESDWPHLYESVENIIHSANYKAGWNFKLTGFNQPLRISRYSPGYFHDWHLDYTSSDKSKIAVSCLLNDDFTGGDLQLLEADVPAIKPGQAIVFPAYQGHRVTPVITGHRYVLLAWYTGPRFA